MTDLLTRAVVPAQTTWFRLGAASAALPSRTVSLPVGVPRPLAWPAQDPQAIHTCVLDCTLFLLDAASPNSAGIAAGSDGTARGTTLASALVAADPSLTAGGVGHDAARVWVTLTGGVPGTVPVVSFALFLANGDRMNATVALPIVALSPEIPAGAVAVGGQPITLAHVLIDVSEMPEAPGGVEIADRVLLYRPGPPPAVYLLPANALGGAATGGINAASLALLLSSLPATLPASPGQLWWNGGTLSLS